MSFQIIRSDGSIYIQQILRSKFKQLEDKIDELKARYDYDELMKEFLETLKLKSDEISDQLTEQTEIKIDKIAEDVLNNVTETLNSSDALESVRQEIKNLSTDAKQVAILAETTKQEIKKFSDQTIVGVKDDLIKKILESEDFLNKLKRAITEEQGDEGSINLQKEATKILKAIVEPLKKSAEAVKERIKDLQLQLPVVTDSELQKELKDLIKTAENVSIKLLTEIVNAENKLSNVLNKTEEILQEELEKTLKNQIFQVEENLKADLENIVKNVNLNDKIKQSLTPEILKDLMKDVDIGDKVVEALKDVDMGEQIKKELTPEALKDLMKDVDLSAKVKEGLKNIDLSAKIKEAIENDESLKNFSDDLNKKLEDKYEELLKNLQEFDVDKFREHMWYVLPNIKFVQGLSNKLFNMAAGVYMVFYISILDQPKTLSFAFEAGQDKLFQFEIRFSKNPHIAMNEFYQGSWGIQQDYTESFPFKQRSFSKIEFIFDADKVNITVDDKALTSYSYVKLKNITSVNNLEIEGDLVVDFWRKVDPK
ncbi:hypothetical protein LCDVSa183L [Lymphocystis disease virus 3]|uniref:Galectin domain-containing protein n=1 Tax=Lymphocystis disease virus 3 TaxID=2560566 RepID=A0A1B2RW99_9VIRU|nr:hypothetical protein BZK12_gp183 [Lymphocystis disease virus Sa]AOC55267.1 hypothetical protein LCDVSa183L [Lymphocystis disease virus 3]